MDSQKHRGGVVGHLVPGLGFFLTGLWHLINHIKLHALHPNSYTSVTWFPTTKIRYLELFFIMLGCSISISMELFFGPDGHQPLDPDGTIPSNHLRSFEHSNISIALFVYAAFSILLDKINSPVRYGLSLLLAAIAFGQELLIFHLHAADHMGLEGQYHWLLQILIAISLITTLMGIGYPKSFLISFVRSLSIFFQGVWLIAMGFMLWTPEFIPKGCFLKLEEGHLGNFEDGHLGVQCHSPEALERAKALVNIQFSWYSIGVTIFAVSLYLIINKLSGEKVKYESLDKYDEREEEEECDDV